MKLSILYGLVLSVMAVCAAPQSPPPTPMSATPTTTTTSAPAPPTGIPVQESENSDGSGATPFYITAPIKGVTYTRGDIATIRWSNGIDEAFTIYVLTGEDPKGMQSAGVSFSADGSKGYKDWPVPSSLSDGTYAFQFKFNYEGKLQEAYSDQFKVTGKSVGSSGAAPTPGPASGGMPSSGSFSSAARIASGPSSNSGSAGLQALGGISRQ